MSKIIHATRRARAAINAVAPGEEPRPFEIVRVVRFLGRRTRKQRQHILASQFGVRARSKREQWFGPEGVLA